MAGFDKGKSREIFNISEELDIIEVIAVGWPSDIKALPETFQQQEYSKPRMSADRFLL